jgi:hypothetical protein
MKLKYKIAKLEDVEEKYRDLYEAKDGAFVLSAEGAVGSDKLAEFRDNNVELKRQLEELAEKFKDIDPAKARELLAESKKITDKKMIESGKVEELLTERTAALRADLEGKNKNLTTLLEKATTQLERLVVDNAIQSEAVKLGVRETAVDDVLLRGRQLFKVKDGVAVPLDPNGKVIYGKDGVNPQSIPEWLSGLSTTATHLFKESKGGGTQTTLNGAGGRKEMRRAEYDALDPQLRHDFVTKDKGVVVD